MDTEAGPAISPTADFTSEQKTHIVPVEDGSKTIGHTDDNSIKTEIKVSISRSV